MKAWLIYGLMIALSLVSPAFCAPRPPVRNPASHVVHKVQYGVASWYGARSQGRLMACGEPFNEYALTAAHRTLPLGTEVTVTNLRNGRSVNVRIKDRGPVSHGRVIDLSKAAAMRLGFVRRGLTPVKVQVVYLPPAEPNRTYRRNYS